jgi:hypothetical protein
VSTPTLQAVELHETERACGFRCAGGLYLVGGTAGALTCGKLPLQLQSCPTCGAGIRPSRGFAWINPVPLFAHAWCPHDPRQYETRDATVQTNNQCSFCPLAFVDLRIGKRTGLMWVGSNRYTAESFAAEAEQLGVSRRISAVPKGLTVGSWVFLAHRKAFPSIPGGPPAHPGIFRGFRVTSIDYILTKEEADRLTWERDENAPGRTVADVAGDPLQRYTKRGIRLVKVVPVPREQSGQREG